jgi:hypothetical protein
VQEGVLQPCWQIALCADKEFSKPLQFTNETDTLNVQNEATLVWADEVYEMQVERIHKDPNAYT